MPAPPRPPPPGAMSASPATTSVAGAPLPAMSRPPSTAKPAQAKAPTKVFSIAPWSDSTEGQKVILYGKSGIGKSTLASMFPEAVFIGIDDGGRKLFNPKTGKHVQAILGVDTYQDFRDACKQGVSLIPPGGTLVVDTVTKLEALAEQHVLQTVKTEKGGHAANLLAYGWGGGYRHLFDHMRLVLTDFDALIRSGRNVLLLAQLSQARISNSEGSDYLEDGMKLYHSGPVSVRTEYGEWADFVLRLGYLGLQVTKDNEKAKAGKVTGDSTRAVFSDGALHYMAKSRPVGGKRLPGLISFENEQDDALVQMLFNAAIP